MVLDFKEIPSGNASTGLQDSFELFAREFFEIMGYEILIEPNRGADGKMDLIIRETRRGISGNTKLKWLVSCKHFAISGKSVRDTDEPDISDRIRKFKCDGFIGFYSTIPSASLSSKIVGLKKNHEILIYDRSKIEKKLLSSLPGRTIAARYFPKSGNAHIRNNPRPVKLFKQKYPIKCDHCGNDLLGKKQGIWVGLTSKRKDKDKKKSQTHNAYFSCKGECDFYLKNYYHKKGYSDYGWLDINRFKTPIGFLTELIEYIDRLEYLELHQPAQEKIKVLFKATFPYITRELSDNERSPHAFFVNE